MTRPRRPVPWGRLARAIGFAAVVSLPVTVLAVLVRRPDSALVALDDAVIQAATEVTRDAPALRTVLVAWQTAFLGVWLNSAAIGVCVWFARRYRLRNRAVWAVTTILACWGLALGVKHLVQRARPVVDDAVEIAAGYSFPSGHASNTTSALTTLVLLAWPVLGRRARVVAVVGATTLVVLTGVDRVMLGVHYPSDVVAGAALGAALVGASYLGFLHRPPSAPTRQP